MRAWILALAATSLVVAGFALRPGPAHVRNVILIVVDTLRADHLGLYGYERDTSPNLSRLAASAVVFERARSQAPCTSPSVNSILTSRHPATFLAQPPGVLGIPAGVPSLAEILGERGFRSTAVSASEVVRATPGRFNPLAGFGRGFATFDEQCPDQPADCVNRRLLPLLGDGSQPLFAYVHYMDPHGPYAPPAGYQRRFATWETGNPLIDGGDPVAIQGRPRRPGKGPVTARERQRLIDLYDDEIGFWDTQLGALFAELESRGLLQDTMIVLAADHGESFGSHGRLAHCQSLYESETHVPLVMWIPGVAGQRVAARVENLDIVPTILDYLGIAAAGLDGTSLRPLVERRAGAPHPFVNSFHVNLRSVTSERFKGILDVSSGGLQMYDLDADPGEAVDLVARQLASDAVVSDVRGALQQSIARYEAGGAAQNAEAAGDVVERLRSLGYMN